MEEGIFVAETTYKHGRRHCGKACCFRKALHSFFFSRANAEERETASYGSQRVWWEEIVPLFPTCNRL